jgi:hypothetical protein
LPFHVKQSLLRRVSEELSRFRDDGTIETGPTSSQKQMLRSSKHAQGSAADAPGAA